ncbi:MAG: tetratricopeptide repeat protein [Phycisphaerae bacterium]
MSEDRPESLAQQAYKAFLTGNHVLGLALTDQLLADDPANVTFRCWQVYGMLEAGQYEDAIESAAAGVQAAPEAFPPRLALAQALWAAERLDAAEAAFEYAVRISRNHPYVLSEYASFLAIDRRPEAAEPVAQKAVRAEPGSPHAWAALGLAQYRLGRPAEAKSSLRRALELDPASDRAQLAMESLLRTVGRRGGSQAVAQMMADLPEARELTEKVYKQLRSQELSWEQARQITAGESQQTPEFRYKRATYVLTGVGLGLLVVGTGLFLVDLVIPALIGFTAGALTSAGAVVMSRIKAQPQ